MKTHFILRRSGIFTVLAICGMAVMAFPQKAHAFLGFGGCSAKANNECLLTGALIQAGKHSNRDIVVIDTNKTILADTVTANIGTKYPHDTKGEIKMTLADGKTRTFIEKSVDYPKGIKETVYAVKNKKGKVIGAVIVSTLPIDKN